LALAQLYATYSDDFVVHLENLSDYLFGKKPSKYEIEEKMLDFISAASVKIR
jgi:hypothetical protein